MAKDDVFPLVLCKEKDKVIIENLDGGYETRAKIYLAGLIPGRVIEVVKRYPSSGAMEVKITAATITPLRRFLGGMVTEITLVRRN